MERQEMKISKSEIWTNFTMRKLLISLTMVFLMVQIKKIIQFGHESVFLNCQHGVIEKTEIKSLGVNRIAVDIKSDHQNEHKNKVESIKS